MTSLKEKSLKGMFWDFTGRIGLQSVGFVVSIILARILAPEDFGLLAIMMVFINLATVFQDVGFSTALIQRSEVKESHYSSVFYINVVTGLLLATLLFFAAPFVAEFYGSPQLTNLTRLMSLSFIINSFGIVPRTRLRRDMNFKIISVTNVIAALISGVIAIYMACNDYGVWSLAVQVITSQFFANVLLYLFYRRHIYKTFSLNSIKELCGVGYRMFLSGLIDTLFVNTDSLIIGKVTNTSTLGYYYRAKSLETFSARYTSSALSSVLLPGLSSLQHDHERLKHSVTKIFHVLTFVTLFLCGLLLVTAREIIILLFSSKWEHAVIMFQIIIACAFAEQIFIFFYSTLISTGNVQKYFVINILSKTMLFVNFGLLIFWGLYIYLILFALIRLITLCLAMISVTRLLNLGNYLYKNISKYLFVYICTVLIIIIIRYTHTFDNLLISLVATAIYFTTIFLISSWLLRCEGMKLFFDELSAIKIKRLN